MPDKGDKELLGTELSDIQLENVTGGEYSRGLYYYYFCVQCGKRSSNYRGNYIEQAVNYHKSICVYADVRISPMNQ